MSKLSYLAFGVFFGAAAMLLPGVSQAGVITITDSGQGWFGTDTQFGIAVNGNYLLGNCGNGCGGLGETRDFFEFSIPKLAGTITSATFVFDVGSFVGPQSGISEQLTSTSSLTFGVLGEGTVYADMTLTQAESNTYESITLDAAALAAIGKGGGTFTISGRDIDPITFGPAQNTEYVYGYTDTPTELVISTAPEPATWAMMLIGAAGVGFAFRRHARTQA